jgi:hypothetical protein
VQVPAQRRGGGARQLRLAGARLAAHQQRPLRRQRQVQRVDLVLRPLMNEAVETRDGVGFEVLQQLSDVSLHVFCL